MKNFTFSIHCPECALDLEYEATVDYSAKSDIDGNRGTTEITVKQTGQGCPHQDSLEEKAEEMATEILYES